ncbi:MAG: branched-chain amino acid ABC transporter permease [Bryobacteraceae bacterium]|nr:branched-chain amino acid ABC transporter permease [Bryobacteraceae bacterium]
MTSGLWIQILVQTLIYTSMYALFGLGYVLIYRASRVFNFAIAEMGLFCVLLFTTCYASFGLGWAVVLTTAGSLGLGAALYLGIFSRLVGQEEWSQMIVSFALSIALLAICGLIWGTGIRHIDVPGKSDTLFQIPQAVTLTVTDVVLVVMGFAVWAILSWATTMSRLGVYMRATAENPLLAAQQGLPVTLIICTAWGVGALVSAVASISYGIRLQVDPSMILLGLVAVPAALLGGLDSVFGKLPGAIILGAAQATATAFLGSAAGDVVAFAVLLLVLLVLPHGLFGSKQVRRV